MLGNDARVKFEMHKCGAYRKFKVKGRRVYLQLGAMTNNPYNGQCPYPINHVAGVLVDVNGKAIDDNATHFFPDGFLTTNVHLLLAAIAGTDAQARVASAIAGSSGVPPAEAGTEAGAGTDADAGTEADVIGNTPKVAVIGTDLGIEPGPLPPPKIDPFNRNEDGEFYVPGFGAQRGDDVIEPSPMASKKSK